MFLIFLFFIFALLIARVPMRYAVARPHLKYVIEILRRVIRQCNKEMCEVKRNFHFNLSFGVDSSHVIVDTKMDVHVILYPNPNIYRLIVCDYILMSYREWHDNCPQLCLVLNPQVKPNKSLCNSIILPILGRWLSVKRHGRIGSKSMSNYF